MAVFNNRTCSAIKLASALLNNDASINDNIDDKIIDY